MTATTMTRPRSGSQAADKPLRILVAPHPIGTQMRLLAEGLRRRGYVAKAVSYEPFPFEGCADQSLGLSPGRNRLWKAQRACLFAARAMRSYDVFHFFFGQSLIPGHWDLPILRRLGKKIYVHFRGSDIRQRRYLRDVVQRKVLGLPVGTGTAPSSLRQQRLLRVWRKYAHGMLVSIPELLHIVPEATLVPQAIDLSGWRYSPEAEGTGEVVIAHSATDRAVKGTEHVVAAVERLQAEGYPVRLSLIENMPRHQMADLYGKAHIGVDEVAQGSYGNVAIEFMALGRPVVAYLDPIYERLRPGLPVVNATPLDLADRLRPLVEDRALRVDLGRRGRAYVERWHSVDRVVDQLIEIYEQ